MDSETIPSTSFCAKEQNNFSEFGNILHQKSTFFHFATHNKHVFEVKSNLAHDMTLQNYFSMKSTYCSVIIIFLLAIALLKKEMQVL